MSHYELLVILPGKLSETELPASTQMVHALCGAAGVTITKEEPLGKRKLAYDIKGEQYGYYHRIECDAEPAIIADCAKRMSLSPEILRHALYAKPIKSQEVLQKETQLRERVAQRRATKAAIRASDAATLVEKIPSAPSVVDVAALDKKLEEILTTPEKV